MIELSFFYCPRDNAMRGGIWGKGPFKSFGPKPSVCRETEWMAVDREAFKDLAVEHFSVDWSKEIPFWSKSRETITSDGSGGETAGVSGGLK